MNLSNAAHYGREMSNVHQCHPRVNLKDFEWFPDFVISVNSYLGEAPRYVQRQRFIFQERKLINSYFLP